MAANTKVVMQKALNLTRKQLGICPNSGPCFCTGECREPKKSDPYSKEKEYMYSDLAYLEKMKKDQSGST